MEKNLFFRLLETGNIKFDEDRLMILNAFQMILPITVFLKLRQLLIKNNERQAQEIFKELGKYQVNQAIKRYKKVLNIEKLSKEKAMEFMIQHASLMGFGKIKFIKFDIKPLYIIITDANNPLATENKILYGVSKEPIDDYFIGMLEELYSEFSKKGIECKETFCIAKGDKICQFEITEKKG